MISQEELNKLKLLLDSKSEENIELAFIIGKGIPNFKQKLWEMYPRSELHFKYLLLRKGDPWPCRGLKDYFIKGYHHYSAYRKTIYKADLGCKFYGGMPDWLEHINAESWVLSGNRLHHCPTFLSRVERTILSLNLRSNQIETFPLKEDLFLNKLEYLNLGNNGLKKLTPEIGELTGLTQLILRDNYLEELPTELQKLRSLKLLSLCNNNLTPNTLTVIASIKQLQFLALNNNVLTKLKADHLPPYTGYLYLRNTGLEDQDLEALRHLKDKLYILDLSHNKLTQIPDWLKDAKNLLQLFFDGNPIQTLPDWSNDDDPDWILKEDYRLERIRKNRQRNTSEKKKPSRLQSWFKSLKTYLKKTK
ncbi:MAG: leucine-rich repeat domain-containing protein [Aureispira sp.]|nr:leucine-rich repeat domain-containing protein [Aureispira sp.]